MARKCRCTDCRRPQPADEVALQRSANNFRLQPLTAGCDDADSDEDGGLGAAADAASDAAEGEGEWSGEQGAWAPAGWEPRPALQSAPAGLAAGGLGRALWEKMYGGGRGGGEGQRGTVSRGSEGMAALFQRQEARRPLHKPARPRTSTCAFWDPVRFCMILYDPVRSRATFASHTHRCRLCLAQKPCTDACKVRGMSKIHPACCLRLSPSTYLPQ